MGSIGRVVINLGETIKKTKFTPPSQIKATPNIIANNNDGMCLSSVSCVDDITVTSSNKNKELHVSYSTPTSKDPTEGKSTAVMKVMRDKPKDGYHHHHRNKHYKQKLMQVLLDSRSDGDLVFVNKDKPMLLPYSKKAGSTVVKYFE